MDLFRRHHICQMPHCSVNIEQDQSFCAGHIYLTQVELRRTEEFAAKSRTLLARLEIHRTNTPL